LYVYSLFLAYCGRVHTTGLFLTSDIIEVFSGDCLCLSP